MAFPESSLKDLSALIERMTRPDGRSRHLPMGSQHKKWIEPTLIIMIVVNTALLAIALQIERRYPGLLPARISPNWALVTIVPSMAYFLLFFYDAGKMLLEQRRNPWGTIYKQFQADMVFDAAYIEQLKAFPKDMLKYALVQYRHRWSRVDGRVMLLSGDVKKLGLFPALLAILVATPKLWEGPWSTWIWPAVAMTGGFYLIAFLVIASGERRAQVFDLLEYAIAQPEPAAPGNTSLPNPVQHSLGVAPRHPSSDAPNQPTAPAPGKSRHGTGQLPDTAARDPVGI